MNTGQRTVAGLLAVAALAIGPRAFAQPDPTGVCCIDTPVSCVIETEDACALLGGIYGGDNTDCFFNPFGGCTCGPGAGDCLVANGSPGCELLECCEPVCFNDPACCSFEWDAMCADAAAAFCSCPWDCQAVPSGAVDVPDLLALLGAWGGPQTPGTTCDLNGSGIIDVPDLLKLLANWGPCPSKPTVVITDTFDQELPPVVETFWQFPFGPDPPPMGLDPTVNEIGFKAKVSGLGGRTVRKYKWTIDGPLGPMPLTPLGGINTGQDASFKCCGTTFNLPPGNTTLEGPNACAVEFKSWIGDTGVGLKTVKVDVTLSNDSVITDVITVRVLSYLTETLPGKGRGHSLLKEHYGWHSCFDQGDCDAATNPFWNVGAAAELPGADYKAGYLFFKFHRRFAVTEYTAYRMAAGLDAVPETAHIPLVFPYPLRTGGGLGPGGDCPFTGSSDPQTITSVPFALNPPLGFGTSHALGISAHMINWHFALHNDFCSHGDARAFTSPRDIALYWWHIKVDDVWDSWLTANPTEPHFYVVVDDRVPGPGGSITQANLLDVGILVTFSDIVMDVKKEDLTLTDAAGTIKVATDISGCGVGPYAFKFFDVPAPGPVTVTLKKGTIKHQDPTDPDLVNGPRDNTLESSVSWQIMVDPNP